MKDTHKFLKTDEAIYLLGHGPFGHSATFYNYVLDGDKYKLTADYSKTRVFQTRDEALEFLRDVGAKPLYS